MPCGADESNRFRWVACQLDALSSCLNLSRLRQALESLPETLDETYDRILCNIDPFFKQETLHILQWLTFSWRPLSLEEIAEIVAFDIENDTKYNNENRLAEPEDVLNICSSLVITTDTDSDDSKEGENGNTLGLEPTSASKTKVTMVRLAHFSVKEYLVSDRIRIGPAAFFSIDEKVSNSVIGETCLSCLLLYNEASFSNSKEFSQEFPLAKYSAQFWNNHLLECGKAHLPPHPLAMKLFLSDEKMRNWIALYDFDSHVSGKETPAPESPGSPLYYAVLTGLKTLVETLIEFHEDLDEEAKRSNGNKPNHSDTDDGSAAAQYMSKDAYVNATGGNLHTPLQAASWFGLTDTVELLIKHGADPNIYGGCGGGSALSAAARNGCLDIMKLLLDTGADLYEVLETSDSSTGSNTGNSDARNDQGQEHEAIKDHLQQQLSILTERTKKLAQLGATTILGGSNRADDYKKKCKEDRRALEKCKTTALFEAACLGNAEIVKFMLDRGALINLRNGEGVETALVWASRDVLRLPSPLTTPRIL